jgi:ISXO2-like transposase domain
LIGHDGAKLTHLSHPAPGESRSRILPAVRARRITYYVPVTPALGSKRTYGRERRQSGHPSRFWQAPAVTRASRSCQNVLAWRSPSSASMLVHRGIPMIHAPRSWCGLEPWTTRRAWPFMGESSVCSCARDEDACTNQAESFFSRLRRAEIGQHHRIGVHLHQYAGEMAWREDNRRKPTGAQFMLCAGAAAVHPVSRRWAGYWQR